MRLFTTATAAAFAILSSGWTAAQAQPALQGVKSVGIVISQLDAEKISCGFTLEALDARIRDSLASSTIKISPVAPPQALVVTLNVIKIDDGTCMANLGLQFRKYAESEKSIGVFWDRNRILLGSPSYIRDITIPALEGWTKEFIAAWLKANPR